MRSWLLAPAGRAELGVEHQQPAERTQRSPDSTGHLFVLLFFFLFSFFLRTKLGLFLLFLFAFISFPLITHIRFSLLEPTFPQWRLLSNVTEPPHRYRTHSQQPHARSTRVIRVLAPNGSIWVNIPDDTAAEIVVHLKGRGLHMVNWCLWHYRFGQCRDTCFISSKTHLLYFAKDPDRPIWNPDDVLEQSDRASIYGDPRTQQTERPGMRVPLDVWYGPYWGRIQGNNKERRSKHHNQIPEVLLERIIRACSNENDLVLDPFLGNGTTCTVARALNRRSIGIEIDAEYAASAFERIQEGPVRLGNRPQPPDTLGRSRVAGASHRLG